RAIARLGACSAACTRGLKSGQISSGTLAAKFRMRCAAALNRIAPGRQYWLALGARTQPLGNAVNEQIGDLVFAQVALGEGLVILPQPLPKLRYRRLRQQQPAALISAIDQAGSG